MRRASALLVLAVLASGCTGLGIGGASVDEPAFTVDPESGGKDTVFTVDAGKLAGGMRASWDFGDGTLAEGRTAKHAYNFTNGEMTMTLILTEDGKQGLATRTVKLGTGKNAPPAARLTASPSWAEVGRTVTLDSRASDADKDPLRILWSMRAEGASEVVALPSTDVKTSVTFDKPGRYVVTARVMDPKGGEATRNATLDVSKRIPASNLQLVWNGTLAAGTGGAGVGEKVWGTPAPPQAGEAPVDSARHAYSLKYPASTFIILQWNDTSQQGAFDLDLELRDAAGGTVFKSETRAPAAPVEFNVTQQEPGDYTVVVRAVAGAQVAYTLTVFATLQLTPELVNKVET